MATEQITDDELLALRVLANTRGGVKLGSSVLLRLLNTVAALRAQLAERCVVGPDEVVVKRADWEARAQSADVVTVPREEWERLQKFERDTKETDSRVCSDCAHYRRSQSCPGCTHPENPQNDYAFDWTMAQRCTLYALRSEEAGKDAT